MNEPRTVGEILANDPVVLKRVLELVDTMRALQRDYFKTKDPATLSACKRSEKQVDAAIASLRSRPGFL